MGGRVMYRIVPYGIVPNTKSATHHIIGMFRTLLSFSILTSSLRDIHYVNDLQSRNFDEEGGLPRCVGNEYYYMAHADVAISVAMGETATASATDIA